MDCSEKVQTITPWSTECSTNGFDYNEMIKKFGVQPINNELLVRFKQVTGHEPHYWLKRGIFFAHRDLENILDDHEQGKPIFLYTGRGPTTEALHLGHMIPFIFTKWLQDVFNAILVIQMADDEKYFFKDTSFEEIYKLQFENVKDIIACGFNPERTFVFSNHDYCMNPAPSKLIHEMHKKFNMNVIKAIFGLPDGACLGQYVWPLHQMAASLSKFFEPIFGNEPVRCLVACAIDQDPYFRGIRDKAEQLASFKPCVIMSQFLPALEGNTKMNSTYSNGHKTIFMTDDPKTILNTIKKHAFSGCKQTLAEHRIHGANLAIDISYQYLKYFLEDDNELQRIAQEYSSGRMGANEVKIILSNLLSTFIASHQEKRNAVTQNDINYFYNIDKFKNTVNN